LDGGGRGGILSKCWLITSLKKGTIKFVWVRQLEEKIDLLGKKLKGKEEEE
jgi:hypothetical protein